MTLYSKSEVSWFWFECVEFTGQDHVRMNRQDNLTMDFYQKHLRITPKLKEILLINIYIYSRPQRDSFFLSELFRVARHVGRSKPGSKPIQLYVRLSLRQLDQQAYNVGKGNF